VLQNEDRLLRADMLQHKGMLQHEDLRYSTHQVMMQDAHMYWVATTCSRLFKMIGLFCRISSLL